MIPYVLACISRTRSAYLARSREGQGSSTKRFNFGLSAVMEERSREANPRRVRDLGDGAVEVRSSSVNMRGCPL